MVHSRSSRALGLIAQLGSELLKLTIDLRRLFDVVQKRNVIAGLIIAKCYSQNLGYRFCFRGVISTVNRDSTHRTARYCADPVTSPLKALNSSLVASFASCTFG